MSIAILGTKTTCLRLVEQLGSRVDLVVTLDDADDGRSRTADIAAAAAQSGARLVVAGSAKQAYEAIDDADPDVVFVAGWYRLIPVDVLERRPRGFVGVHYSSLPRYRGSAPVVWAMINGEPDVGFSIFRMTPGMDEGPIAAQGTVAVAEGDTIADVLDRLDASSLSALAEIADSIADGTLPFTPQDPAGVSYAGARAPADGLLDWTRPSHELARFVRAQTRPYPGAFSYLGPALVRVWGASDDHGVPYDGAPGQVVRMIGTRPVVACGERSGLVLDELESDGPLAFSLLRSRFTAQPSG